MNTILVTGGAGFVGSNFVRMVLDQHPHCTVVTLDKLTYAGHLANLEGYLDRPRHIFVKGDICDNRLVAELVTAYGVQAIINFAAESHVDRSLADPDPFIATNVQGTLALLKAALANKVRRFIQISTDEVYGSLDPGEYFTEETPVRPNSPYSASKAAADHLVHAFSHCWDLKSNITRCSNNYGPFQFPEKMLPLMIHNAIREKPLPIYGDGLHVRDWLYVYDHCTAIWKVLTEGEPGRTYNIGGNNAKTNLEVIGLLLDHLQKPHSLITHVKDRPGHDRRYAIDSLRISAELGWRPSVTFEEGLARTVNWYLNNSEWLKTVASWVFQKDLGLKAGERTAACRAGLDPASRP